MLPPPSVARLYVLVAERTPVCSLRRLAYQALLCLGVFVEDGLMDALATAGALLELGGLVALLEQVLVVGLDLDHLAAVLALGQHCAVLPEVHVQVLVGREGLVRPVAELALHQLLVRFSHVFLLRPRLRPLRIYVRANRFLRRGAFGLSLGWIHPVDLAETRFQVIDLGLPQACQGGFYLGPDSFIDFHDDVVSLSPDVAVLVLVAEEGVLDALLVVDIVLGDWEFLQHFVQQLHPA